MDNVDLHPPDDYSHRFFIWHEWIQVGPIHTRPPALPSTLTFFSQANGPLTAENVFDYFSHSMFYDKQSNNQVLRMQTMHTGQPLANEAEELKCVESDTRSIHSLIGSPPQAIHRCRVRCNPLGTSHVFHHSETREALL